MTTVQRTHSVVGTRETLTTLEQRFRFEGRGVTARLLADLLLAAPLVGPGSVFGKAKGKEDKVARTEKLRILRGFSPAPLFTFDLQLQRIDDSVKGLPTFLVRFSQPDAIVPFILGGCIWIFRDEGGKAGVVVLDEQINTEKAAEMGAEPLTGTSFSFRRALFFRIGHPKVMVQLTENLAALLTSSSS